MTDMNAEKRSLERLLCLNYFSDASLSSNDEVVDVTPVNFHRKGMAIFTAEPIPDTDQFSLNFEYCHEELSSKVSNLLVRIVYSNEIDIGCEYGLEFKTTENENKELEMIEKTLSKAQSSSDRYGLFD